jgi:hypothetical protein
MNKYSQKLILVLWLEFSIKLLNYAVCWVAGEPVRTKTADYIIYYTSKEIYTPKIRYTLCSGFHCRAVFGLIGIQLYCGLEKRKQCFIYVFWQHKFAKVCLFPSGYTDCPYENNYSKNMVKNRPFWVNIVNMVNQ